MLDDFREANMNRAAHHIDFGQPNAEIDQKMANG